MKRIWFVNKSVASSILLLALLFIISYPQVQAQQTNPASFLEIGAGARATSVGGAFVAVADDVSATYWNPAGLAQLTGTTISIMNRLSAFDTNYANTNLAFPISNLGMLGLNFTYYGVGDVTAYDDEGKEVGSLSDIETAFIISYAYGLGRFLVGGNLKYIYKRLSLNDMSPPDSPSKIGGGGGGGTGFDAALLYKLTENFSVGAIWHDEFTITYSDQHKETVPMSICAGSAYRLNFGDKHALALMLDFNQSRQHPLKLHLGSELILFKLISVRAGINDLYVESRNSDLKYIDLLKHNIKPTMGVGFKWAVKEGGFLTMDYALSIQRLGKLSFFTLGLQVLQL